uniref:Homocysteine S-methyltransferase 4 n=1 Tax=Zea mays TaxID=4577 RepID=HMT4_MAIZE|nr:RecName: Full=Homocysteine S-methyltransferase 4; AltName: Full=S-methylmethionine:homocysteine methyltransferase 4; Short=SMM:Hcy S-methyltransferase 4; AltName: Full=ZmHMT-4 [Zea mays]AAG22540.1 homocysteine S-methyltransferase-4 [Zea mays]
MWFGGGPIDAAGALRGFVREAGGCAVVDGGLGTELEAHGADLHDALWSAKCLASAPHLIRKVHLDYLEAGADVIISASYQATIEGFQSRGFSRDESEELLRRSVHVAQEARRVFAAEGDRSSRRGRPPALVAASVGSYGAYRADGSEYSGDYGKSMTKEDLKNFHRRRLQVLAGAGPDLIAFETIPNKLEAQVYAELLEENGIRIPAWFSFTSKDGVNAASGDPINECAAVADSCPRVDAVGVNCTAPRFIHGLILSIKKVTSKPIVVYPNSGETYVAETNEWVDSDGATGTDDFVSRVGEWRRAGAALIGGCCRTSPATVRAIARAVREAEYDDIPAVAVL